MNPLLDPLMRIKHRVFEDTEDSKPNSLCPLNLRAENLRFMGRGNPQRMDASWTHELALARNADYQVCCVAGFQTRGPIENARRADLEIGDTAGLETCATQGLFIGRENRNSIIHLSLIQQ